MGCIIIHIDCIIPSSTLLFMIFMLYHIICILIMFHHTSSFAFCFHHVLMVSIVFIIFILFYQFAQFSSCCIIHNVYWLLSFFVDFTNVV